MRALSLTCLWPGLAALWVRGRWMGLLVAVAFAAALNFALLATFAGEMLPTTGLPGWSMTVGAWVFVVWFWVLGVRSGRNEVSRPPQPGTITLPADDWLREAQTQYLKGHWIEAETYLSKLLAHEPQDVEARLLLAQVQRRTRRGAAARKLLTELERDESAAGWAWEIQSELARMTASEEESRTPPAARAA